MKANEVGLGDLDKAAKKTHQQKVEYAMKRAGMTEELVQRAVTNGIRIVVDVKPKAQENNAIKGLRSCVVKTGEEI